MYVVVRRYTGAAALVDAMVPRAQEIRDLISSVPGFRAYYAVDGGNGTVATITICDSKEGTDESIRRAADWVRQNVTGASMSPPEITEGEAYIDF